MGGSPSLRQKRCQNFRLASPCDPPPILCLIKRPHVPADHQNVGILGREPKLQAVPPALPRKEDLAALPMALRRHHILYDDHAQHILVLSGPLAFVAAVVERGPGHGSDFSKQFLVFHVYLHRGFLFARLVVESGPNADGGLGAGMVGGTSEHEREKVYKI